jgi:pimeloyl-ACP methyl ester carboxylesterase
MAEIEYLDVDGRSIAYRLRRGNVPTLVFLPGYASDMDGTKAMALDAFAAERGFSTLRLDYSGTGSSGGHFEEGTLARWLQDALAVVDRLSEGPLILVGSSMGGWIALHLALIRPGRVRAVVGIAAAPDFTEWGFSTQQKDALARDGRIEEPNPYGPGPTIFTRDFWQSGQQLRLLEDEILITCPVRLLHGELDQEVPLDVALQLMRRLRSSDVQLNVLKGAGHRLSEPHEIRAIVGTIAALLEPSA